jgi:hypothetical protein
MFTIYNIKPTSEGMVKTESKASFKVSEIKSIIFGGTSSRFWMFRKHMNTLRNKDLMKAPFFCWECLTVQMPHRDIDLVVRN